MHQKWCLHVSCIKLNCHMSLWAVSNSRKHYFIIQNDNVLLAKAFKILFSFFSHSQLSLVHFSCLSCVRSASSPWQQSPQFPFQFCVLRLAFFCFSVLYCVISLACLAVPNFPVCPLTRFYLQMRVWVDYQREVEERNLKTREEHDRSI